MKRALAAALAALLLLPLARAQEIPDRPEQIDYPALDWTPPDPAKFRVPGLAGVVRYVVEDPSLPLATVTAWFDAGEPGTALREIGVPLLLDGGTFDRSGTEIRRAVEALGGRISVDVDREWARAQVSVFSKDLPAAVDLLADVLLRPGFREDALERFRAERIDEWNRRNDDVGRMTARLFRQFALGDLHPFNFHLSPVDFRDLDRTTLFRWHEETFRHPRELFLTLAGRIPDREALLAQIRKRFESVVYGPDEPRPAVEMRPHHRIFLVDRPGATQGNVRIGAPAMAENDPDYLSFLVMNHVLGGGGFPSRITKKVRSDEGLAYSVGSRIDTGMRIAGDFHVGFQTRSAMVPYAIRLVLDEIDRMRSDGVTDEELAAAKAALIERLPSRFETPEETAEAFGELEIAGFPLGYWSTYAGRIEAITKEEVLRVARKWLPTRETATIVVVGDAKAILAGDPTGVHPESLHDFGDVHPLDER